MSNHKEAVITTTLRAPGSSPVYQESTERQIERIHLPDGRVAERITETHHSSYGRQQEQVRLAPSDPWWEVPLGCLIWIVFFLLIGLAFT